MPLSDLAAILAASRAEGADIQAVAQRSADALLRAANATSCEIWLWRSRADDDRSLERLAVAGVSQAGPLVNTGTLRVTSDLDAFGVELRSYGALNNSGTIEAIGVDGNPADRANQAPVRLASSRYTAGRVSMATVERNQCGPTRRLVKIPRPRQHLDVPRMPSPRRRVG